MEVEVCLTGSVTSSSAPPTGAESVTTGSVGVEAAGSDFGELSVAIDVKTAGSDFEMLPKGLSSCCAWASLIAKKRVLKNTTIALTQAKINQRRKTSCCFEDISSWLLTYLPTTIQ